MKEIIIHSVIFSYFKRYFWKLSSLYFQKKLNVEMPKIKIIASVYKSDPFIEMADRMLRLFPLDISLDFTEDKDRGIVRNKVMVTNRDAEWILFDDADQIYDYQFFSHLAENSSRFINSPKPVGVPIYKTENDFRDIPLLYNLIGKEDYNSIIENPIEKLRDIVLKKADLHCRACGGFQLFSMKAVNEVNKTNILYPSGPNLGKPEYMEKRIRCKSDVKVRRKYGGSQHFKEALPRYHFNHYRIKDKEFAHIYNLGN